jgi:hypothetical protein
VNRTVALCVLSTVTFFASLLPYTGALAKPRPSSFDVFEAETIGGLDVVRFQHPRLRSRCFVAVRDRTSGSVALTETRGRVCS